MSAGLGSQPRPAGPTGPQPDAQEEADAFWRRLRVEACAPYRRAGHFAWHFARGKLGYDPVFRALLERGALPPGARIVDIGAGQSLIASLCAVIDRQHAAGRWPAVWGPPPLDASYTSIELMSRDVERARRSLATLAKTPTLICADMRKVALPPCDVVVILDVLHYVDLEAQAAVLLRVREALQPHGRLLMRIGDASSRRGYARSQWVDRTVTRIRGHRVPPTWGRPLGEWVALLEGLGFSVATVPMNGSLPFANVLLVADLKAPAAAAAPAAAHRVTAGEGAGAR